METLGWLITKGKLQTGKQQIAKPGKRKPQNHEKENRRTAE